MSDVERIPPQDDEMEKALLACMILSEDALAWAVVQMRADDFYKSAHRAIFEAAVSAFRDNSKLDLVLLRNKLQESDLLDKVGGMAYLVEIMESVTSAANVEFYGQGVRNNAMRRKLIQAATVASNKAYDKATPIIETLQRLDLEVGNILLGREDTLRPYSEIAADVYAKLDNPDPAIPYGIYPLDQMTGGAHLGEFILIAGRPSMGKSSLMLKFISHQILSRGEGCILLISIEEMATRIVQTMACTRARVNSRDLDSLARIANQKDDPERAKWAAESMQRFIDAVEEFNTGQLMIDDAGKIDPIMIRAKVHRVARSEKLTAVYVDYLQLIDPLSGRNRNEEVTEISRALKQIAKDYQVPVIVVSQLSRALTHRPSKRPLLSDLRDSGALEQDADCVLFVHRPSYYEDDDSSSSKSSPAEPMHDLLIVAKQRHGPVGDIPMMFIREYTDWCPLVDDDRVPPPTHPGEVME